MALGKLASEWRKLPISVSELCIDTTLRCGQSFRWRKSEDDIWSCALHGRILSLRQDSCHLHYRSTSHTTLDARLTPPSSAPPSIIDAPNEKDDTVELIKHYFNLPPDLRPNLTQLYNGWSSADPNFKKKAPKFTGVRILRQDSWEALVCFICSSNNNIVRISQMVDKLCLNYGPLVGYLDSKPYYDFPTPSALTGPNVESNLRQLGFGYRAKYIYQTAVMVAEERDTGWLGNLRNPESPAFGAKRPPVSAGAWQVQGRQGYREAHEQLLELQGVGPKVADCVCLMGLGWGEAVPVDTHVWQIAQRDYKFGKGKHSSLTKTTYDAVADHFRGLWGQEAGWAQSVLFTANLKAFAERLHSKVEVKEENVVKEEADGEVVVDVTSVLTRKRVPERMTGELETEELGGEKTVTRKRMKRGRKS